MYKIRFQSNYTLTQFNIDRTPKNYGKQEQSSHGERLRREYHATGRQHSTGTESLNYF